MAESIDLSQKKPWTLVKFTHGGPSSPEAFTNKDSRIDFGGVIYASTPAMEVQLPENNGILQDAQLVVTLPLSEDPTDFTQLYTNGQEFASTRVEVIEQIVAENAEGTTVTNTVFKGRCGEYVRNSEGEPGLIRIEAEPLKSWIKEIALGLPCNHQCVHALGDAGCKVDMGLSSRTINVEISDIDGSTVTVTSPSVPNGLEDRFYQRGSMTFEGLTVSVHDWRNEIEGNKLIFFMRRQPPSAWDGEVVVLKAGCDKTIEICRSRFANEENFLGIGFSIPPYHPNFEDGGALQ